MNEIQKYIEEAFKMLSAITVSGDNVDMMALAKEQLRKAYKLAGEITAEEAADDGR